MDINNINLLEKIDGDSDLIFQNWRDTKKEYNMIDFYFQDFQISRYKIIDLLFKFLIKL